MMNKQSGNFQNTEAENIKFGIMSLQVDSIIPNHLSGDELFGYISTISQAAMVRRLYEHGFQAIELSGDLGVFLPYLLEENQILGLKQLQSELGLVYTVHLPLWSVELSTPVRPIRQGSIKALEECIRAYDILDIEVYVLHATGHLAAEFYRMDNSDIARSILLRQFQMNAKESIQELLSSTGLPPRKLAVETIEFPLELTLEIVEDLDLSFCLDTGHILAGFSGVIDLFEILEKILPRLKEVHLHDAPWFGKSGKPGYGSDHQKLGDGDLDVNRLLKRLASASFEGPIIFELKLDEALSSMDYIHRLQ